MSAHIEILAVQRSLLLSNVIKLVLCRSRSIPSLFSSCVLALKP